MNNKTSPPFLNVLSGIFDKLTDVLNFGRILSIGIPGFITAFGLMMLVSLVGTPLYVASPAEPAAEPETQTAQAGLEPVASADAVAPSASTDIDEVQARPDYRRRIVHDFRNTVQWWYLWLIGSVMTGSVIGVWTYFYLRTRERLHERWQQLVKDVENRLGQVWPAENERQKALNSVLKMPAIWPQLRRKIDLAARLDSGHDWQRKLAEHRYQSCRQSGDTGDRSLSWVNVHLPLLTGDLSGSSYHDHLVKEYWRFVEFAANFPVALIIALYTLALYALRLPAATDLSRADSLIAAGLLLFPALCGTLLFVFAWHPQVVHACYRKYRYAGQGVIAGMLLFHPGSEPGKQVKPDKPPGIPGPDQDLPKPLLERICPCDYLDITGTYCDRIKRLFDRLPSDQVEEPIRTTKRKLKS